MDTAICLGGPYDGRIVEGIGGYAIVFPVYPGESVRYLCSLDRDQAGRRIFKWVP